MSVVAITGEFTNAKAFLAHIVEGIKPTDGVLIFTFTEDEAGELDIRFGQIYARQSHCALAAAELLKLAAY